MGPRCLDDFPGPDFGSAVLWWIFRLKIVSEIDAKGASRAEIDAQRGLKSRAEMSALLSKPPKVGRIRSQGVPDPIRLRGSIQLRPAFSPLRLLRPLPLPLSDCARPPARFLVPRVSWSRPTPFAFDSTCGRESATNAIWGSNGINAM